MRLFREAAFPACTLPVLCSAGRLGRRRFFPVLGHSLRLRELRRRRTQVACFVVLSQMRLFREAALFPDRQVRKITVIVRLRFPYRTPRRRLRIAAWFERFVVRRDCTVRVRSPARLSVGRRYSSRDHLMVRIGVPFDRGDRRLGFRFAARQIEQAGVYFLQTPQRDSLFDSRHIPHLPPSGDLSQRLPQFDLQFVVSHNLLAFYPIPKIVFIPVFFINRAKFFPYMPGFAGETADRPSVRRAAYSPKYFIYNSLRLSRKGSNFAIYLLR